jgi:hypothetical protein
MTQNIPILTPYFSVCSFLRSLEKLLSDDSFKKIVSLLSSIFPYTFKDVYHVSLLNAIGAFNSLLSIILEFGTEKIVNIGTVVDAQANPFFVINLSNFGLLPRKDLPEFMLLYLNLGNRLFGMKLLVDWHMYWGFIFMRFILRHQGWVIFSYD